MTHVCKNHFCMNHECVQLSTTLHSWTLLLDCYGQLESREKSLPSTQLFDTNFFSHELRSNETESLLKDADSLRLSTLPSLRYPHWRPTSTSWWCLVAVVIVCRCCHHGALTDDTTPSSCRCLVATVCRCRRHGPVTDDKTLTSGWCLVAVPTVRRPWNPHRCSLATPRCSLYCYHYLNSFVIDSFCSGTIFHPLVIQVITVLFCVLFITIVFYIL